MLPDITTDLNQAESDIREHGIALISNLLSNEQLALAREATYSGAKQDIELGRKADKFPLDYGEGNVRVWNILSRHQVFREMVQLPFGLDLIEKVIGKYALLSNISANIAEPGNSNGGWHADQMYMPQPWPGKPQIINLGWALDDFSSGNGATEVVPGSHLDPNIDPSSYDERAVPLVAPAGTLIAFEGRLIHRSGCNRSSAPRAGLFAAYTRPIYRPQENWFLSLDREIVDSASDELLILLGYKAKGLGLVYGKSPR